MRSRKLLALSISIGFHLLGCADDARAPSPQPDSKADSSQADVSKRVIFRGSFATVEEKTRFEQKLQPEVLSFIRHWESFGLRLPYGSISIVVSPPATKPTQEALRDLYGDEFFPALAAFRAAVANAATVEDVLTLFENFQCAYPPFVQMTARGARDVIEQGQQLTLEEWKVGLDGAVEEILQAEAYVFSPNGAFHSPSMQESCSFVVLGRSREPNRPDKHEELDIVLHEVGHALAGGIGLSHAGFSWSVEANAARAFSETIADVLAHVYLNVPCHGRSLPTGNAAAGCRRMMDGFDMDVSAHLGRGDDPYYALQALRVASWRMRQTYKLDEVSRYIVDAIHAAYATLPQPAAPSPDRMIAWASDFSLNYDMASAYFDGLCKLSFAACAERARYLGSDNAQLLADVEIMAPSKILGAGRRLHDGRTVTFDVLPDGNLELTIHELDGAVHRAVNDRRHQPVYEKDGALWLFFSDPAGPQWFWNSKGELTEAACVAPVSCRP